MAATLVACEHADDDYIDMEISSYSCLLYPTPREFEFQMSSWNQERDHTTSPADELFYKGKLLPLHLPPRLQMVEKILHSSNSAHAIANNEDNFELYTTPLATTTNPTPISRTPYESCNITPSESCQVSGELNPDEYMFEYSNAVRNFSGENQKKSWTKKLKQSSLGLKLRASRTYLKSLFGKSGCSNEVFAASMKVGDEASASNANNYLNKQMKSNKNSFGQIQRENYQCSLSVTNTMSNQNVIENTSNRHRRSFSMSIRRISTNKSPASSGSNRPYKLQEWQFLKRCSSTNSDRENSIQGAIAHCKQSQKKFPKRKQATQVGFFSLSTSRISISENQERPELCRG